MISGSGFWGFIFRIIDGRMKWFGSFLYFIFLDRINPPSLKLRRGKQDYLDFLLTADGRRPLAERPARPKLPIAARLIKFIYLHKFIVRLSFCYFFIPRQRDDVPFSRAGRAIKKSAPVCVCLAVNLASHVNPARPVE
jgi:hypothetical protein